MGIQVTEAGEHMVLAQWLNMRHGLVWCHVPNGGARHIATAVAMSKMGVARGVPDILIFTPPPTPPRGRRKWVGTAVELKRPGRKGRASADQAAWLEALTNVGWQTRVCHGATDAINWLVCLGY